MHVTVRKQVKLEVGQRWRVKLKGAQACVEVEVHQVGTTTVSLITVNERAAYNKPTVYAAHDLKWVELLEAADAR